MLPINISSGSGRVLTTGSVIQFNHQPIKFNLELPGFPLTIIMHFENDIHSSQRMAAKSIDNNTISLTFYNYNNPLGTGTSKALKIADYQGEHIYLNYRIYAISENSEKSVEYTFYLSEELI